MTLLKKVSQPIETANGLPNPLYTDPAVYAEESRKLLLGNWSGIAFEGDAGPVAQQQLAALFRVDRRVGVEGVGQAVGGFDRLGHFFQERHGAGSFCLTPSGLINLSQCLLADSDP